VREPGPNVIHPCFSRIRGGACPAHASRTVDVQRSKYAPSHDFIQAPPQEAYFEPINWYRTKLHELTHWTGHASRLNRDFSGRRGGDAYARE
jgi:antirestriction protein ArdC